MIEGIENLGYKKMILRCDGEPALKAVQEEVKARRNYQTIVEHSPVVESGANGAAHRAVQVVEVRVRVVRHGLETRLGMKISGQHPFGCWLIEHALTTRGFLEPTAQKAIKEGCQGCKGAGCRIPGARSLRTLRGPYGEVN